MKKDVGIDVKHNPKQFWKYANSKGKQNPGYRS